MVIPDNAAISGINRMLTYLPPSMIAACTSALPWVLLTILAILSASSASVATLLPKTLMETSPVLPVSISETRICIGWVKPILMPGKFTSTFLISAISSAFVSKRQWLAGVSSINTSVSFSPIGSRPSSSEPVRATICFISGIASSSACSI